MKKLIVALVLTLAQTALAHEGMKQAVMPKEFDSLKQLVGTWEGTTTMDGKETKVTVVYELTSAGTAVVEKLFKGTPEEMVSVYHKEGKSLGMTHYCGIGNQPHMRLKKSDSKMMAFEMVKTDGISSPKEDHMHAVTLTFNDADSMTETWSHYHDGASAGLVTFALKRVK